DAASRAQPVDVLAPLLPGGHVPGATVAGEDLTLLEVDVDGVVPAAAAVLQRPGPAGVLARRRRDPADVRGAHVSAIGLHSPGAEERADRIAGRLLGAASELEGPGARDRNLRQVRIRDQDGGHLADVGGGRIAHDAEFEELADARILRLP